MTPGGRLPRPGGFAPLPGCISVRYVEDVPRLLGLLLLLLTGCGSKTGLLIPDASEDSGVDAGSLDGRVCTSTRDPLLQRDPEVLFVLDQSRSMEFGIDGSTDAPRDESRWALFGQSLVRSIEAREDELSLGVLLFPDAPAPITTIVDACTLAPGVDIPVAEGNLPRLRQLFRDGDPNGGTPTALALQEARRQFERPAAPGVQRFVVLATDGAPNCNPTPAVGPPDCVCTGDNPMACTDPETGVYQCLDDVTAIDAVESLSQDAGVPVYVIGIEDPSRPTFGDVLDAMAVAGSRPRPEGGRRYYDVGEASDLDRALQEITDSLDRCVYYLGGFLDPDQVVQVRIGRTGLARDPDRQEGWDITNPAAGEITLFGNACALAEAAPETPTAFGECL